MPATPLHTFSCATHSSTTTSSRHRWTLRRRMSAVEGDGAPHPFEHLPPLNSKVPLIHMCFLMVPVTQDGTHQRSASAVRVLDDIDVMAVRRCGCLDPTPRLLCGWINARLV